jgi:hypothetical protein
MVETCIHCGEKINTHCRCSQTCYCGRPISKKVNIIGKSNAKSRKEFTLITSDNFWYQGMCHYERVVKGLTYNNYPIFLDKKGYLYTI